MTRPHHIPELDPIDATLYEMLFTYEDFRKELGADHSIVTEMWDTITWYASENGIKQVNRIA